jgi:hypothetical protein
VSNVRCGLYTSSGSTERFLHTETGNIDRRAAGAILRHEKEDKVRPPVSGRAVLLTLQIGRTRFTIIIPTPFSSRSAEHGWLYASDALERYAAASLLNANMHPFAAYYEHTSDICRPSGLLSSTEVPPTALVRGTPLPRLCLFVIQTSTRLRCSFLDTPYSSLRLPIPSSSSQPSLRPQRLRLVVMSV